MKKIILSSFLFAFISCNFDSPNDYLREAEIAARNKNYQKAITLTYKEILMDKKFVAAYIDKAIYNSLIGENENAVRDFKNAESIDKKNTVALYNIALIYNKVKKFDLALEYSNKAFASKDKGIGTYIDYNENAFGNTGRKDIKAAYIYFERAKANYNLSKFKDAKNDFLMCIDDNYKNMECYYWIGYIYLKSGERKLACENFKMSQLLGNKNVETELKINCN